jgi:hypothetical protein
VYSVKQPTKELLSFITYRLAEDNLSARLGGSLAHGEGGWREPLNLTSRILALFSAWLIEREHSSDGLQMTMWARTQPIAAHTFAFHLQSWRLVPIAVIHQDACGGREASQPLILQGIHYDFLQTLHPTEMTRGTRSNLCASI